MAKRYARSLALAVLLALGACTAGSEAASPKTPSHAVSSDEPTPKPTASGGMWPQTSLEEVRRAQDLADAGDPRYTWQVDQVLVSYNNDSDALQDPSRALGAEIFERFIREELGWEEFSGFDIAGWDETLKGVQFIRCAPGRTNPLYPKPYRDMPSEVAVCAPTIDDFRYETVTFDVEQLVHGGPSGIWVVTGWELLQPAPPGSTLPGRRSSDAHLYPHFEQRQVEQLAPPSNAEVTALLQAFLAARVDGEGAEKYLHYHGAPSPDEAVPLLYATTGGTPYERSEIGRVQGPVWPTGWMEFKVRLFAEDGTVVEQSLVAVRQEDGRLGLVYGSQTGDLPTTENGQAVPVPYSLLDGEVTFAAAPPWSYVFTDGRALGLRAFDSDSFVEIWTDPLTVEMGCDAGPAPADAEALARSIRSNPDLEAIAPVSVRVGGIDALRMDVDVAEASDCGMVTGAEPPPGVFLPSCRCWRMRLYLLDLPEGMSARILAIAIAAPDQDFEHVVGAAAPIVDSIQFHTE